MDDGKVKVKTTIDDSDVDKGLKRVNKKITNFANKLKSSDMANLGASITGVVSGISASFKVAATAIKGVSKAIKDTTDAYKTQMKAELQLDNAVKNSPFLDGSSARALKEYASSIQSVTTYGDEQLIPFMAELANEGRSQQQIMDIIKAATDVAASGMMDLGSAVSALNMTFQGTSGSLGRQIASIKNLTEEELKSGKAIQIIKAQFDGTAESIAQNIGTSEQLANAWGDLKEEIGAGWEKPLSKVRVWLKGIIDDAIEGRKRVREIKEADENIEAGIGTMENYEVSIKHANDRLKELRDSLNNLKSKASGEGITPEEEEFWMGKSNAKDYFKSELKKAQDEISTLKEEVAEYTEKLNNLKEAEKEAAAELKKHNEEAQNQKEIQDKLKQSTENYSKIIAKRDSAIKNLEREAAALGQEVDKQSVLNIEMEAYLEMAKDPYLPTMTGKQLEHVKSLVAEMQNLNLEESKREAFMNALSNIDVSDDLKKSDILKEQLKTYDMISEAFFQSETYEKMSPNERMKIWDEYQKKRIKLEKDITKATEEESRKQLTSLNEILTTINDFLNQTSQILGNITSLARQNAEDNAELETKKLEKQFKEGILSEKEYEEEKARIEKEAAKRKYQLDMWEWSSSLVQIGTSTAQAVVNALATSGDPILGIAMAGLIGSMGAAQLGTAIANKPIPPSFASGGIVGGGAYSTGDNIRANIKSGEMILNDRQQMNLWRLAQGSGKVSNGNNIEIKNYRGNDTTVTPQFTEDGIRILIRKTVADDLANRRLNGALVSAENQINGINYSS